MNRQIENALHTVQVESRRKMGALAKGLVYAPSEQKEAIWANFKLYRWLAEACAVRLYGDHPPTDRDAPKDGPRYPH